MSIRVLIADDAAFMRNMLRKILTQAGYEVVGEASTGTEAVEKYKEVRPHVVTMDIVMPEKDGIEAVREIIEFDPNAVIIMCSALGQQSMIIEAIQAGAKDYIIKPFQPNKVVETIKKVVHRTS
ncbi:MAG: response regulator [Euryarchaeota archaeon]|nr:response regulator [Euryarchaeota archaeon]